MSWPGLSTAGVETGPKSTGGGPDSFSRKSAKSSSVLPGNSFTMTTKWFWSARFLNLSQPLRGMAAGRLAHFVLSTAVSVASTFMLAPVSTPPTDSCSHGEPVLLESTA